MLRIFLALTVLLATASAPAAYAKHCRDATSGKFTKCEKVKVVKCRDSRGRFVKCKAVVPQQSQPTSAAPSEELKPVAPTIPADNTPNAN